MVLLKQFSLQLCAAIRQISDHCLEFKKFR
jgi:hypothetical protein